MSEAIYNIGYDTTSLYLVSMLIAYYVGKIVIKELIKTIKEEGHC